MAASYKGVHASDYITTSVHNLNRYLAISYEQYWKFTIIPPPVVIDRKSDNWLRNLNWS